MLVPRITIDNLDNAIDLEKSAAGSGDSDPACRACVAVSKATTCPGIALQIDALTVDVRRCRDEIRGVRMAMVRSMVAIAIVCVVAIIGSVAWGQEPPPPPSRADKMAESSGDSSPPASSLSGVFDDGLPYVATYVMGQRRLTVASRLPPRSVLFDDSGSLTLTWEGKKEPFAVRATEKGLVVAIGGLTAYVPMITLADNSGKLVEIRVTEKDSG